MRHPARRWNPLALLLLCGPAGAADAPKAATRFDLSDPALTLSTGGRTAACDALAFTADGASLLAVGDDKVVHTWDVADAGLRYRTALRWNTFREVRGSIFYMALSADERDVAVAGYGRLDADVTVISRRSGRVRNALTAAAHHPGTGYAVRSGTVWALAFDPPGNRLAVGWEDGSVWVWDIQENKLAEAAGPIPGYKQRPETDAEWLAAREARVVGVGFLAGERLWFARRSGDVLTVPVPPLAAPVTPGSETVPPPPPPPAPERLFRFGAAISKLEATRDGRYVAATPLRESAAGGSAVEVWDLPARRRVAAVPFPRGDFPTAAAVGYDPAGRLRLALGLRLQPEHRKVYFEPPGEVRVYDLGGGTPAVTARQGFGATDPVKSAPETIALHPDGRRLAVAGGWNHETSLWEPAGGGRLRAVGPPAVGVGTSLWAVGLSKDGTILSVKDVPHPNPPDPNTRADAKAPWRSFNLADRTWLPTGLTRPLDPKAPAAPKARTPEVRPITTLGGWTVVPDDRNEFVWRVRHPNRREDAALELNDPTDGRPICYTFLPPAPGDERVRLAVGHYWGFSVFVLEAGRPYRVYRGVGHAGYVTGIVCTPDGKRVVTSSRDETVCVWDLTPWPDHPNLGIAVGLEDGLATVTRVADGGAGWEAGVVVGDVIERVNPGNTAWATDPRRVVIDVRAASPGQELAMVLRRGPPGVPVAQRQAVGAKTRLYGRPVWRFFPTRSNDWVLYRYQDYFYDCGTEGDSYVGYLVNGTDDPTPTFVTADQVRERYRQPGMIADFLKSQARDPQPFLRTFRPPVITLEPTARGPAGGAAPSALRIVVEPPPPERPLPGIPALPPPPLLKVELWVDDEVKLAEWGQSAWPFETTYKLDPDVLRNGTNRLKVVAYTQGRQEKELTVEHRPAGGPPPSTIRALVVGVGTYDQVLKDRDLRGAVPDAKLMTEALNGLKGRPGVADAKVVPLLDGQATRGAILKHLDLLTAGTEYGAIKPDDWLVVYLAGHGHGEEVKGQRAMKPESWFFIPYNRPGPTFSEVVTAKELHEKLDRINCRKLMLLDSCYSGAATISNPARDLRKNGKGAVVLAAAGSEQEANEGFVTILRNGKEVRESHGYFTAAVYHALGPKAAEADRNRDGLLGLDELHRYAAAQVRKFREEDDAEEVTQTVNMSPAVVRNVGLYLPPLPPVSPPK